MVRPSKHVILAAALAAPLVTGCDLTKMAANQTAHVFHRAAPAFDEQSDYEFAGAAAPGSVLQIEGVLRVVPHSKELLLEGTKGWAGYAFGYVEDEMEQAEDRGDLDEADRQRARARAMYLRGRDLGLRLLEEMAEGSGQAISRGPDRLRDFLRHEFDDREDAEALFWAGYSWGGAINVSLDDPALIADLPLARTLVERSVELDEGYYNAAGLAFLGYANSIIGEQLGGNPTRGREYFERGLEVTEHKALLIQFNFARSYAVQTQDRALFTQLMQEVLDADEDILPEARLPNVIAKRRAARWMARLDSLIDPNPPAPIPESETEATDETP